MHFYTTIERIAMNPLQSYLDNNDWAVQLHSLQLLSEDNYQHIHALRVEGSVTDIPKTIMKVLPFLQEEMRGDPEMQSTLEILDIIGEDLQPTVELAPFVQKPEKMAKIAGIIVREDREKLCERFNDLLLEKGIPVVIEAIHITE
ncbi:MAG: hypothetical protein IJI67_08460 [Clostridia bacterium]|nr:hypothetical protein [Clostridia bacterium]